MLSLIRKLYEARKQNEEAKKALQEWMNKQGHDRCHYYPEIFNKIIRIYGLTSTLNPNLPPREEFEIGCKRYQEEEYLRSQKSSLK